MEYDFNLGRIGLRLIAMRRILDMSTGVTKLKLSVSKSSIINRSVY
jgi:hypothetical protein